MTHEQTQQLCALAAQHRAEIAFVQALIAGGIDELTLKLALDRVVVHLNERITTVIAAQHRMEEVHDLD